MSKRATIDGQQFHVGAISPEEIEYNQKIRNAASQFRDCIASVEDVLEEPLKSKFTEVRDHIEVMISNIPAAPTPDQMIGEIGAIVKQFSPQTKPKPAKFSGLC